jgi:hypothetical protein
MREHAARQGVAGKYYDEAASAYRGSRGPGLRNAKAHASALAAEHGRPFCSSSPSIVAWGDGRTAAHLVEYVLEGVKAGYGSRPSAKFLAEKWRSSVQASMGSALLRARAPSSPARRHAAAMKRVQFSQRESAERGRSLSARLRVQGLRRPHPRLVGKGLSAQRILDEPSLPTETPSASEFGGKRCPTLIGRSEGERTLLARWTSCRLSASAFDAHEALRLEFLLLP